MGRWTQEDPLNLFQDPKQANRYAYAGVDPVNHVDPSGLITDGERFLNELLEIGEETTRSPKALRAIGKGVGVVGVVVSGIEIQSQLNEAAGCPSVGESVEAFFSDPLGAVTERQPGCL